jgi:hypothetical protein
VKNSFPPPTALKQLDDVLPEKWYKILLQTVQNAYEFIRKRIAVALKTNVGPTPY